MQNGKAFFCDLYIRWCMCVCVYIYMSELTVSETVLEELTQCVLKKMGRVTLGGLKWQVELAFRDEKKYHDFLG